MLDRINAGGDSARDELVALCRGLVAAPSANPPGDTTAVAGVVLEFLARHGIPACTLSRVETMPNVVATVHGYGPGRHLILNVHMDTMPPGDEASWTVPRFELTAREGRLYGLGMGNMKGAVAAMCLAVVVLDRARDAWPGSVTFTAVSDECVFGDNGAAFCSRPCRNLLATPSSVAKGPGGCGSPLPKRGWRGSSSRRPVRAGMPRTPQLEAPL